MNVVLFCCHGEIHTVKFRNIEFPPDIQITIPNTVGFFANAIAHPLAFVMKKEREPLCKTGNPLQ